ncbi:MAG: nitrophenyl compound nitroreductase subunit ArsF family protein, partial [Cyanobacteriota bacterium]
SCYFAEPNNKTNLIVYYFHDNYRCSNCIKIENYTREALKNNYARLLKDGSLKYKVVNTEEKNNQHYNKDYQLYTKSIIISKLDNGKEISWKNLDKIWQYLGNQKKFEEYIVKEIKSLINTGK